MEQACPQEGTVAYGHGPYGSLGLPDTLASIQHLCEIRVESIRDLYFLCLNQC